MKNVDIIGDKCVGCRDCELICPKKAIVMKDDSEGFLTPNIDYDKCVDCGICLNTCVGYKGNTVKKNIMNESYIAITTEKDIYKSTASGGIFSTLATEFFNNNKKAAVCGACYLNGEVTHKIIFSSKDIKLLQGSKYVQSDLKDVVANIKQLLELDYKILFSGTPCQIAALINYTGYNKNLYTIDLICHGVPSPAFLRKDLKNYFEIKEIDNISFRKKGSIVKTKSEFFLTVKNKKGKKITTSYKSDVFFSLFMKGVTFRLSCYNCQFANIRRSGDLTIGDCDSASNYDFHNNEATSTVIVNTLKGNELWAKSKRGIDCQKIDLNLEIEKNHQLKQPTNKPKERDEIYKIIDKNDINYLHFKYARKKTIKESVGLFVFNFLPKKMLYAFMNKKDKEKI